MKIIVPTILPQSKHKLIHKHEFIARKTESVFKMGILYESVGCRACLLRQNVFAEYESSLHTWNPLLIYNSYFYYYVD